jgi:hypothetical protein
LVGKGAVESVHELGELAAAMVLGSSALASTAERRGGEWGEKRVEGGMVVLRVP